MIRSLLASFVGAALATTAVGCGSHSQTSIGPTPPAVSGKPTGAALAARAPIPGASASSDIKPASTGTELPKPQPLTPEKALPHVQAGLAEAGKSKPDCPKIIRELEINLAVSHAKATADDVNQYEVAAKCARHSEHWGVLRDIGIAVLTGQPDANGDVLLARADIGSGLFTFAMNALKARSKKAPKDPDMNAALATMFRAIARDSDHDAFKDWDLSAKAAEVAQVENDKQGGDPDIAFEAAVDRADALFHRAKFDEAEKQIEIAKRIRPDDPILPRWEKRNAIVKSDRVGVDKFIADDVFLGVYHLYGKRLGSYRPLPNLVSFAIYNFTRKDLPISVEVEIPGVTDHSKRTTTILKDKYDWVDVTPSLKADYDVGKLRAPQATKVKFKIASQDGNTVFYENEWDVTLHPRDDLPLVMRVNDAIATRTFQLGAAWVTPNAKAVDAFLEKAKEHVPNHRFAGDQRESVPQVAALFQELHDEGMSYVSDPEIDTAFGLVQRTRLPSDVLSSKNAQCLEGQLAYSTLLEAIALRPVQFYVKGHSFVGWLANDYDKTHAEWAKFLVKLPNGDQAFVLETTMTDVAKGLDDVLNAGLRTYKQHIIDGKELETGQATYLLLSDERKAGITPQPTD